MNKFRTSRDDLVLLASLLKPNTKVLDIGCGNGNLLELLRDTKNIDGRGIEISNDKVATSVSKGLSVVNGDADTDLVDYPDNGFDYVILSQTLQAMKNPDYIIKHMLRIGRFAIISIPNFAYWKVRGKLLLTGRMPVTDSLSYNWYDTPNIHFCSIRDFKHYCHSFNINICKRITLNSKGKKTYFQNSLGFSNFMGDQAIFLLEKNV